MLTYFSFTIGFSNKFSIKQLSYFSPHMNYVATLPCDVTLSFYLSCYKTLACIEIHIFFT